MKNVSKQQGFTLIELIVVIVILGILAVTAAPKFIRFTGDANTAALAGVAGGIKSAMAVYNAKAAIDGTELDATATTSDIPMVYGYPAGSATGIIAATNISAGLTTLTNDYVYNIDATSGVVVTLAPVGKATAVTTGSATATEVKSGNCYIVYTQASATGTPLVYTPASVSVTKSGC